LVPSKSNEMADENKNQDPEENKKGPSDDDDFGLPDFEFEALDDDDLTGLDDSADAPSAIGEDTSETIGDDDFNFDDIDLDNLDKIEGLEDLDLGDIDLDDLGDLDLDSEFGTEEPAEVPVQKEPESAEADPYAAASGSDEPEVGREGSGITDNIFGDDMPDLSAEDMSDVFGDEGPALVDEKDTLFYEEESFEDFTPGPVLDETPVLTEFGAEPEKEVKKKSISDHGTFDSKVEIVSDAEIEKSKGQFIRIVVIGTILFFGIGFGFYSFYKSQNGGEKPKADVGHSHKEEPKKEEPKKEEPKVDEPKKDEPKKEEPKKAEPKKEEPKKQEPKKEDPKKQEPKKEDPKKAEPKKEEPKKQEPKKQETKTETTSPRTSPSKTTLPIGGAPGTVTQITNKTGKVHVIIGSFIDSDMAMDLAQKLAGEGKSPSIIAPYDGGINHRVVIASFDNVASAQAQLESFRATYGAGTWLLRY
jgi:cell division protein FtsN